VYSLENNRLHKALLTV